MQERLNKIAVWNVGIRKSVDEDKLKHPTFIIQLCSACRSSINNKSVKTPPKFALCNNFVAGDPPEEIKDASWAEWRMCTLAPVSALVRTIGRHKNQLCSHSLAIMSAPSLPVHQVTYLPTVDTL
jgi:hypothetical protein